MTEEKEEIRCPNCGEDRKFQVEKVISGKRIEWYCNTCGKQFDPKQK